jgi:hypothetical protein
MSGAVKSASAMMVRAATRAWIGIANQPMVICSARISQMPLQLC